MRCRLIGKMVAEGSIGGRGEKRFWSAIVLPCNQFTSCLEIGRSCSQWFSQQKFSHSANIERTYAVLRMKCHECQLGGGTP
jgi:hypothetical protein